MLDLCKRELKQVSGGAPTAAEAIQAGTAVGAGVGASWVISASGGTAAGVVGTYGMGSVALLGAAGAGLAGAGYVGWEIGTAINNIDYVNRRLGDLVDWIFGSP